MADIDALAQEIRRADGAHKLGAGALAEALRPWLAAHDRAVAANALRDAAERMPRLFQSGTLAENWLRAAAYDIEEGAVDDPR